MAIYLKKNICTHVNAQPSFWLLSSRGRYSIISENWNHNKCIRGRHGNSKCTVTLQPEHESHLISTLPLILFAFYQAGSMSLFQRRALAHPECYVDCESSLESQTPIPHSGASSTWWSFHDWLYNNAKHLGSNKVFLCCWQPFFKLMLKEKKLEICIMQHKHNSFRWPVLFLMISTYLFISHYSFVLTVNNCRCSCFPVLIRLSQTMWCMCEVLYIYIYNNAPVYKDLDSANNSMSGLILPALLKQSSSLLNQVFRIMHIHVSPESSITTCTTRAVDYNNVIFNTVCIQYMLRLWSYVWSVLSDVFIYFVIYVTWLISNL